MNIEEAIRDMAVRGFSRRYAAEILGFSKGKFATIISAMPDIQWVAPNDSVRNRESRERARGQLRSEKQREAARKQCAALHAARNESFKKYTAFGVTDTLPALTERFGVVRIQAVRKRLKKGISIEEALTMKNQSLKQGTANLLKFFESRRKHNYDRLRHIIPHFLTPTMLRYKAKHHDIQVVKRKAPYIAVEVRKKGNSALLHRLQFLTSFESGVIFLFNSNIKDQIDFIAFEPDCPAIRQ
ncbi:hypothetical protein [Pseudomonas aeruginosa]|uniref:hypothetical protein n=1 Tax=Pseudomonas aeruginosa TaxID=287 RepID=UPI0031B70745